MVLKIKCHKYKDYANKILGQNFQKPIQAYFVSLGFCAYSMNVELQCTNCLSLQTICHKKVHNMRLIKLLLEFVQDSHLTNFTSSLVQVYCFMWMRLLYHSEKVKM